jgi:XapX domain-containing protein
VVSLLTGLAVGMACRLFQFRSPAPPLIALIGPLGEPAVGFANHHLAPGGLTSIRKVRDDFQGLLNLPPRHESAAKEGQDR